MQGTRQKNYGYLDDQPVVDGDVGFRGVDERTNPAQLAPGFLSYGENLRFRNGVAEPRLGDFLMFCMQTNGDTPWSEIYTAARIEDPQTGQELLLVAADGGVYWTAPHTPATSLSLPAGVTLTADTAVQFVQCFNVVLLLRGQDERPLVLRKLATGFEAITQAAAGTGTQVIPNSRFGIFYQNRMLCVKDGDEVVASDLLDYTRYESYTEFKINQGDNDRLIAMHPFNESTLLMLKDQSVWRVDNIHGDLSNMILRNVTTKYGCVAPFSVVDYGTDVAWLSDRGITTLKLTQENEVQGTDVSLSDPLVKTMRRVNWAHAANCVAEAWDSKLYFALPLDGAQIVSDTDEADGLSYNGSGQVTVTGLTVGATYQYAPSDADEYVEDGNSRYWGPVDFVAQNTSVTLNGDASASVTATLKEVLHEGVCNGVVVYDNVTQAWCGLDTRAGLNIKRWVKLTYDGRLRLGYVSWDGEVRLYEEGLEDEVFSTINPAYCDITVVDFPNNGTTIQLGGGDIITAGYLATTNTASVLAAAESEGLAGIGQNLWDADSYGFSPDATNTWDSGGTYTLQQIDRGLRVVSADGTLPVVKVDGSTISSSGFAGNNNGSQLPEAAFYIDAHSGSMVTTTPISTVHETRGHLGSLPGMKKFIDCILELETWSPTFTVAQVLDGANDTLASGLSAQTRARSLFKTGSSYTTTNTSDNHGNAQREDYSVVLDDGQVGVALGDNGVDCELEQHFSEKIRLDQEESRFSRLQITNTTGRLTLKAVHTSARPGQRSYLTH